MSKRVKKWEKRTDPDLVNTAYRASRDVQLELGRQAQLEHDQLISKVKSIIEDRITNPALKAPYVSFAQKVMALRKKYGHELASKQAAGEIMKWETRGLDRDLMLLVARALDVDPAPFLATLGARGGKYPAKIVAATDSPEWIKRIADYVCDGVDDQKEINSALQESEAVVLAPGTYSIGAEEVFYRPYPGIEFYYGIKIPSGRILMGFGGDTILKAQEEISKLGFVVIFSEDSENIVVADLLVDGNWDRPNVSYLYGIVLNLVEDALIRGVTIKNVYGMGLFLGGTKNIKILYTVCENEFYDAIDIGNDLKTNSVSSSDILVAWCRFLNSMMGLFAADVSRLVVMFSEFRGNQREGIDLEDSDDCLILGNLCWENSQESDNAYDNIKLGGDCDYCVLQLNRCRIGGQTNRPRYGINIDSSDCEGTWVTNNDLYNSGVSGALRDAGTGTVTEAGNRA